ncbi:kinase-like protein [Ceraceosorus guamensis]|uniref:Kinase-like protein n=1 Tax=Ceraceosorus guamensis TaxID=1522189 RepID=A0A316VYA3_9BASI|nr:kinase-like protein [Ceraceosorus guamensis]PWN42422.1 kinase-like protein [Ceraceosorus guamensis]
MSVPHLPPQDNGADVRHLASTSAAAVSTPTAATFAARGAMASSNAIAPSSAGDSSALAETRRQSEGRPHVPRLETDAAALGLASPSRPFADFTQSGFAGVAPLVLGSESTSKQSASSKTGAFFGSNGGASSTPILPASASGSSSFAGWSSHRRETSATSSISSAMGNQSLVGDTSARLGHSSSTFSIGSLDSVGGISTSGPEGATGIVRQGSSGRAASGRWAGGFGSSLQTPSTGDLSSASSTRSRRVWEEFEGKPITPLPSPGVVAASNQAAGLGYFESRSAGLGANDHASTSRSSLERQGRPHDFMSRTDLQEQEEHAEPETPVSRNRAFFGSSAPSPLGQVSSPVSASSFFFSSAAPKATPAPAPSRGATAPRAASGGGSWLARGAMGAGTDEVARPEFALSPPATLASAPNANLRGPSRLPTMPVAGMPISGTSSVASTSSASLAQAPMESLPSAMTGHAIPPWIKQSPPPSTTTRAFVQNPQLALEERMSSLPSAALGAGDANRTGDASHPQAPSQGRGPILTPETQFARIGVSDPPVLEPAPARSRNGSSQSAAEVAGDRADSLLLPAAQRRGGASRHVHGPSENASGSSFLPVAATSSGPAGARVELGSGAAIDSARRQSAATITGIGTGTDADADVEEEEEDANEGRVGQYVIERTLGMGAFSRVVLARRIARDAISSSDTNRSRTHSPTTASRENAAAEAYGNANANGAGQLGEQLVALKMLEREPCAQNERMRVSWVREVEVLKHISHPSIVRFIDSFSTPRHHNLVLEHVDGGELFEFLAKYHPMLAAREWLVRRIFGEVAHAVGWMHSIHLVHRDIKLENIILTKDIFAAVAGQNVAPADVAPVPLLKISDFGLSRFVDPASPMLETRCGSEEYAAPELIIGKRYDGRATDVWALGVVLYALICGFLPFLEDSAGGGVAAAAAREGGQERSARERKAHLLRIAKGDLRWPALTNEACLDVPRAPTPPSNRLVTPAARHITARLLRRDANKRAAAWDVFEDAWMLHGSFSPEQPESSALGQKTNSLTAICLHNPRSGQGQRWLQEHARVIGAVADVARDD